jgi:hypothetical protein
MSVVVHILIYAIANNEATRCEADQTAYELNGFD